MSLHVKPPSVVIALFLVLSSPAMAAAQLGPPTTGGMVVLDEMLQRLGESRRVLMVAAHPDDEDTAFLALMSRGYGVEAAYLALSRGEGGQNLIGPELGGALGLIRSRELLAARELDGASQFFTRAFDFGYTRSIDETHGLWLPDSILKDVVRVVRRFRPHVMITVFSGTQRDGHGQHQAAGIAVRAAFDVAGDPAAFPELQTEEGLAPWTPAKLYQSIRFGRSQGTLRLPTGVLDARVGRSYHQIAMASRSLHRSQDMGTIQAIGPREATLSLIADRVGGTDGADDLFGAIPLESPELAAFAAAARAAIDPTNLASLTPELVAQLEGMTGRPRQLLSNAVTISAGIVTDAVVADDELVPGQAVPVTLSVYNGGPFEVRLDAAVIEAPDGWSVSRARLPQGPLQPGTLDTIAVVVTVDPDAPPTQPYFLENPRTGAMYDWTGAPPELRGRPFQPPLLHARFDLTVLDAPVSIRREATFRARNQAVGEVRREVRVVPLVDVTLDPERVVWSADGDRERDFTVTLVYNGVGAYRGEVGLQIDGWRVPPARPFFLERTGESQRFVFTVTRPDDVRNAQVEIAATAVGDDGQRYARGIALVEYSHIRPTAWVRAARSLVHVAPMRMPSVARIGYIRGAADRVPEALQQIGLPVELLDESRLALGDLSVYDVIVVGSRAYESDSALMRHNGRLLEYTNAGGLLVVQYQQYQFVRGGYAPFPLEISRPHDRVTDENAPVRILQPEHRLFNVPNEIGADDWVGWPQERGLYFAGTWDPAYQPMLEMHDSGRPPLQGGLLVARYGAGTYVYTGLSFFRALPAGNPGGFRLFLNVLGLHPDHEQ
ncbi:MAG: PIG-L family deacetylase [Gemmatimonadetes bacterium]|nr:PIG-L family deacetylase [Gemmatimonadota bacterium]